MIAGQNHRFALIFNKASVVPLDDSDISFSTDLNTHEATVDVEAEREFADDEELATIFRDRIRRAMLEGEKIGAVYTGHAGKFSIEAFISSITVSEGQFSFRLIGYPKER